MRFLFHATTRLSASPTRSPREPVFARAIQASTNSRTRKLLLAIDLTFNLGLLAWFKYAHLLVNTTVSGLSLLGVHVENPLPPILLPIGISFYLFETMSYTIDVYRGQEKAVLSFPLFMSFVVFWPHMVAGPILRISDVVPQIEHRNRPQRDEVLRGIEEILCGLFKKVVLADTIAPIVDQGFARPYTEMGMLDVWTLAFAFGFQIYFDFSGYSQVAIGSARIMGFKFPENFNWPYLATSPRDFWKRWHITLSSWIRDYLYLPLQGTRFRSSSSGGLDTDGQMEVSEGRRSFALFLTWAIMGLWHGASWTFVAWGLWHATFIWLHRKTAPLQDSLPGRFRSLGGWAFTLAYAMLGWIFFRAESLTQAFGMLLRAFDMTQLRLLALREMHYLTVFLYMAGFLAVAAGIKLGERWGRIPALRVAALSASYAAMLYWTVLLLRPIRQFIYFQF